MCYDRNNSNYNRIFWYRVSSRYFVKSYWDLIETTSPKDRDVEEETFYVAKVEERWHSMFG